MRNVVLGFVLFYGGCLFFSLSAAIVIRWLDSRRAERGDKPIHVEAPLSAGQMEKLDDLALMEDLSEDPTWIRDGIESLIIYAVWKQRPAWELEEWSA